MSEGRRESKNADCFAKEKPVSERALQNEDEGEEHKLSDNQKPEEQ